VKRNCISVSLAILAAGACLCTGCGGISATKSFSPASFFLPGLMRADPAPVLPPAAIPTNQPVVVVALSR
jgi:hypothetical protein